LPGARKEKTRYFLGFGADWTLISARPRISPAKEEEFSLPLFVFTVLVTLAGLGLGLRLLAPHGVWLTQISAPGSKVAGVFVAVTALDCFIEFFFHRYALHKPVVPFLRHLYRQHTKHHGLTRIGRRRTPQGREVPFIENVFPMTEPEQKEASFFPWFSLAAFALVLTPLFIALQWLAPSWPWFSAGYAALTCSLLLYEILHAIEHWPFERWGPLIEHPRWGWLWKKAYSFHLRHHAVIECNESISGFFTLPLADWVFGTYVLPETLYADGEEWVAAKFRNPRPYAFIRWCDRMANGIVQRRRQRARLKKGQLTEQEQLAEREDLLALGALPSARSGLK
jgi:hemolysin III